MRTANCQLNVWILLPTLYIFVFWVCPPSVSGLPSGAPICANRPPHGRESGLPSPFKITFSSKCYKPNQLITVTLGGTDKFHGFVVESPAGTFIDDPTAGVESGYRTNCGQYSITHSHHLAKRRIRADWRAPNNTDEPMVFTTTIFKSDVDGSRGGKGQYWYQKTMGTIRVCTGLPTTTTLPPDVTLSAAPSTKQTKVSRDYDSVNWLTTLKPQLATRQPLGSYIPKDNCYGQVDTGSNCAGRVAERPVSCIQQYSAEWSFCHYSCCIMKDYQGGSNNSNKSNNRFRVYSMHKNHSLEWGDNTDFNNNNNNSLIATEAPFGEKTTPVSLLPPVTFGFVNNLIDLKEEDSASNDGLFERCQDLSDLNSACRKWILDRPEACRDHSGYEYIFCKFTCCKEVGVLAAPPPKPPKPKALSAARTPCKSKTDRFKSCRRWVKSYSDPCSRPGSYEAVRCQRSCCIWRKRLIGARRSVSIVGSSAASSVGSAAVQAGRKLRAKSAANSVIKPSLTSSTSAPPSDTNNSTPSFVPTRQSIFRLVQLPREKDFDNVGNCLSLSDVQDACVYWVKNGFDSCQSRRSYVRVYCQRSCCKHARLNAERRERRVRFTTPRPLTTAPALRRLLKGDKRRVKPGDMARPTRPRSLLSSRKRTNNTDSRSSNKQKQQTARPVAPHSPPVAAVNSIHQASVKNLPQKLSLIQNDETNVKGTHPTGSVKTWDISSSSCESVMDSTEYCVGWVRLHPANCRIQRAFEYKHCHYSCCMIKDKKRSADDNDASGKARYGTIRQKATFIRRTKNRRSSSGGGGSNPAAQRSNRNKKSAAQSRGAKGKQRKGREQKHVRELSSFSRNSHRASPRLSSSSSRVGGSSCQSPGIQDTQSYCLEWVIGDSTECARSGSFIQRNCQRSCCRHRLKLIRIRSTTFRSIKISSSSSGGAGAGAGGAAVADSSSRRQHKSKNAVVVLSRDIPLDPLPVPIGTQQQRNQSYFSISSSPAAAAADSNVNQLSSTRTQQQQDLFSSSKQQHSSATNKNGKKGSSDRRQSSAAERSLRNDNNNSEAINFSSESKSTSRLDVPEQGCRGSKDRDKDCPKFVVYYPNTCSQRYSYEFNNCRMSCCLNNRRRRRLLMFLVK